MHIYYSHRGNLSRSNPELENHPGYVKRAIEEGFNVEVDVWYDRNQFYLGHDKPQYRTFLRFLQRKEIICHAKNLEALNILLKEGCHAFWHQNDDYTLTSQGYIWTYPGKPLCENSIAVVPERSSDWDLRGCLGICSDFVKLYRENIIKIPEVVNI